MLFFTLPLAIFFLNAYASPHSISTLEARNDTSLPPPTINVTISSPNGTDVTSAVRVMLYHEPKAVANSDLNARYTPGLSRPQNTCSVRDGDVGPGRFAYSQCEHGSGIAGSLQKFITFCYPPRAAAATKSADSSSSSSSDSDPGTPPANNGRHRPSRMPFSTVGMCAPSEICVDGHGVGSHFDGRKMRTVAHAQLAYCVSTELFVEMAMTATADSGAQSSSSSSPDLPALEGEQARMVFSAADAQTPVRVTEMDLLADSGKAVGAGGMAEKVQGSCTDCVDLFSTRFEPDTLGLKAEATIMGAGTTAAAAAVLWIAIVSG